MKKIIKKFLFFLFISFIAISSFGKETPKFYERLEIGTDISSIFDEDLTGFPGSMLLRLNHKTKPIAYRVSIYNNSIVKHKSDIDDVTTNKYNRCNFSLSTGIDWFFLNEELYKIYLGNEIGAFAYHNKNPGLDNNGNNIDDEQAFTKSYGISDSFNLGAKIKVYKNLSLCAESKLSFGTSFYVTGEKINGNTNTDTKDNTFYIEFDSFSSLTLLYHF